MSGDGTIRVELKRADVAKLVLEHPTLRAARLVLALEHRAAEVLAQGVGRRFPEGTSICHAGHPGEGLFFVLKGEVRLQGLEGERVVDLGTAVAGEVFGEAEALEPGPRRVSAHAATDVDLVELPRAALLDRRALPLALLDYLREVANARTKEKDELQQFLDRW